MAKLHGCCPGHNIKSYFNVYSHNNEGSLSFVFTILGLILFYIFVVVALLDGMKFLGATTAAWHLLIS